MSSHLNPDDPGVSELDREIERVVRQENSLILSAIDHELVWQLGCRVRSMAECRHLSLLIDIRWAGVTAFRSSMRETTALNEDWVRRKRNTVELFEQSSYRVGLELQRAGTSLEQTAPGRSAADYATLGGSFPLRVRGAGLVGVITVSGAPHREDHDIAAAALAELC